MLEAWDDCNKRQAGENRPNTRGQQLRGRGTRQPEGRNNRQQRQVIQAWIPRQLPQTQNQTTEERTLNGNGNGEDTNTNNTSQQSLSALNETTINAGADAMMETQGPEIPMQERPVDTVNGAGGHPTLSYHGTSYRASGSLCNDYVHIPTISRPAITTNMIEPVSQQIIFPTFSDLRREGTQPFQ